MSSPSCTPPYRSVHIQDSCGLWRSGGPPPPAAPGAPLVLNGPSAHTEVLATDPLGRTWVIQTEHRKDGDRGSAVSSPDLQRVNGTARQLYGADIVLVVTNGRFTTHCLPLVQQLHMHLADRRTLATWASDGRSIVAPPRKLGRPELGKSGQELARR
ncbi:restriction endonuclease [Streptomyces cyaneofuscatus]|uniref:restriction endonuclease n=1 Tax=Streptomyces cyaneofuscatus TaxID=66883 RepID=UPI00382BD42C